jgi:cell division septation protein DedD
MVIGVVALLVGGLLYSYNSLKPLGPRIAAAVRKFITLKKPEKPPEIAKAREPQTEKTKAKTPGATTLPPPASTPGLLASQLDIWYRSDKAYPYSIVVASFQKEAPAAAYARSLRSSGHLATVAPTKLEKLGRWYRVVLNRHETLQEARQALSTLKEKKGFEKAWIKRLPFAVEVGTETGRAAAEATRNALSAKGAFALLFPEASASDQPVTFRLIAGAFSSKDQAEAFAASLSKDGISAQVIAP